MDIPPKTDPGPDAEDADDWLAARLGSAAAMATLAAIGGGLCNEAKQHVPEADPLFSVMVYAGLGMVWRAENQPTRAAASAAIGAFRHLMEQAAAAGYPVASGVTDDDPELAEVSPKAPH